MNKYGNTRTWSDLCSRFFASKAEARRGEDLAMLEQAKEITLLEYQPRWKLMVNGQLICTYIGDFRYYDCQQKRWVVEDVKGVETREFHIKRKLMKAMHGIEIEVVH